MDFFDLHCDTITTAMHQSVGLDCGYLDISFPKNEEIKKHCQCFAIFCPDVISGEDAFNYYTMAKHFFKNQLSEFPQYFEQVKAAEDIDRITGCGKTAAILTVEGGRVLGGKIERLKKLYNDGVRMMTLTWNGENEIGKGSTDQNFGLKPFGIDVIKEMEKLGMTHIEVHLNEWNPFADERGTEHHSAECMAMMLCMQNEKIDVMNLYDARIAGGNHMALFDPYTQKPHHAYYSLVAFDHLYKLQNQAELKCDTEGIYSLCATNGNKNIIVISNISGQKHELNIEGVNLDDARFSVIDQKRLLSWSPKVDIIENNQVVMIEF